MTEKRIFRLVHDEARRRAVDFVRTAPDGWTVRVEPPKRSLDQSAKFHAICGDIAKSGHQFAGKPRTALQWKVLLVSGHAVATGLGSEILPGIEGEFVNIRESTAQMSVKRGASLIEYCLAYCAANGIRISDE